MSPDLKAIRARVELARMKRPDSGIIRDLDALLDYTEALIAALREARECVRGCDWTVGDEEDTEYSHTLEPHDGDHLLERIDALLPPEPQG